MAKSGSYEGYIRDQLHGGCGHRAGSYKLRGARKTDYGEAAGEKSTVRRASSAAKAALRREGGGRFPPPSLKRAGQGERSLLGEELPMVQSEHYSDPTLIRGCRTNFLKN